MSRVAAAMALLALVTASPPPRPGRVLIERLRLLADSGRMADPAFVARTLRMHFTIKADAIAPYEASITYPLACAPGLAPRAGSFATYRPDPATALRQTPAGRATMTRAGVGPINSQPAEVKGDPALIYTVAVTHDCTGYVQLETETRVRLTVAPLSTHDCVTQGELAAWQPAAQRGYATDGAEVWSYRNPRTGAQISFDFFALTPCMLSVSVDQEPRLTGRYEVAQGTQASCMLPHKVAFCRRHEPFGWGDGDVQSEMDADGTRHCGTLDSFLAHTPARARPTMTSAPFEQPDRSTPCTWVNGLAAMQGRR